MTPPSKDCRGRYCLFQTAWFLKGFNRPLSQLAQMLDAAVGRPVIDRTGLAGNFDFDVAWAKEGDALKDPSDQTPEDLASLFTALREQLGLALEPTRAPYDVLVVESISRPTPN